MVKLNHTLKAATLMESLIAMIIIVVCFGVATMIYSNVLGSDKQRLQLKAILVLNQEAIETKKEKSFVDMEKQVGDWTIKKTLEKYPETENVYRLELTLSDKDGKVVGKRNELISIE